MLRGLGDVSRAQKQYQISWLHRRAERLPQCVERGCQLDGLALSTDRLREEAAIDAGNFRLAGGINLGQPQPVRLLETGGELLKQKLRAREAMRLKCDEQSARAELFESAQGRRDFAGMMAVVVEDAETMVAK